MKVKDLLQRCHDALYSDNATLGEICDGRELATYEKLSRMQMMKRAEQALQVNHKALSELEEVLKKLHLVKENLDDPFGTDPHDDAGASDHGTSGAAGVDQRQGAGS